jgi:RimJ/RimL family protein N-acetyltransferase
VKLRLHLIDREGAGQIINGSSPTGFRPAPDFPAETDRISARLFIERCDAGTDPRPYGVFLVFLANEDADHEDGQESRLAIGGIGFHGSVDERGRVEIGYGIVASQQGNGYATEALRLLIDLAGGLGARTLTAETEPENVASQKVLRKCDFQQVGGDEGPRSFERRLQ